MLTLVRSTLTSRYPVLTVNTRISIEDLLLMIVHNYFLKNLSFTFALQKGVSVFL